MKLELIFVTIFAILVLYDGYLKGPISQIYNLGKIITGTAVITYLLYSYIKNPGDIYKALDFVQSFLLNKDGLNPINRIIDVKKKQDRNVSQLLKKKVAANQKWQCGHCFNILDASYEVDHIIALYKGGSNEEHNLLALCRNCHGKKTVEERLL